MQALGVAAPRVKVSTLYIVECTYIAWGGDGFLIT